MSSRSDNIVGLYAAFTTLANSRADLTLHPYGGEPKTGFQVRMTRVCDGLTVDLYVAPSTHRSELGQIEWELWAGPEASSVALLAPLEVRRANFNLGYRMQGG